MKESFLNLIQNTEIQTDLLGISQDIKAFWCEDDDIISYDAKMDAEKKIYINVKLKHFSHVAANLLFFQFMNFVGYKYFNAYFVEESESGIKYLYFTATQERKGVLMEISFT